MMNKLTPLDLRIGNLIEFDGKIFKVKAIEQYILTADRGKGNVDFTYAEINPVPITEDWLLRAGFTEEEFANEFILYKQEFIFKAIFSNKIPNKFLWLDLNTNSTTNVKTLSDLQNLVKTLTGQELEINTK